MEIHLETENEEKKLHLKVILGFSAIFFLQSLMQMTRISTQLGALCCNLELSKYQEVESSHMVTDYKHNLSLLN